VSIHIPVRQLSPEWWAARAGVPTASEFGRIMMPVKRTYSRAAAGYMAELAKDCICQNPPVFTDRGSPIRSLQNGRDLEPLARNWYRENVGPVDEAGFVVTDDLRFGCSPDGLIGKDGGIEIFCPSSKHHQEIFDKGEVVREKICQVHGSLIVTGRKWWHFLCYSEWFDPLLVFVTPNDFTAELNGFLEQFWSEYEPILEKHTGRKIPAGIARAVAELGGQAPDQTPSLAVHGTTGEDQVQERPDEGNRDENRSADFVPDF
jgi:YqaJ-like recombinase protein